MAGITIISRNPFSQIANPLWIAGVINLLQSFQNGSRQDPINNLRTGLYVNDQEFIAWGLKIFVPSNI